MWTWIIGVVCTKRAVYKVMIGIPCWNEFTPMVGLSLVSPELDDCNLDLSSVVRISAPLGHRIPVP
jgi:hypothetical protein